MSEHTLSLRHLIKCGREGCHCLVDPGNSYCGEQCEHGDDASASTLHSGEAVCGCGHGDCKPAAAGRPQKAAAARSSRARTEVAGKRHR